MTAGPRHGRRLSSTFGTRPSPGSRRGAAGGSRPPQPMHHVRPCQSHPHRSRCRHRNPHPLTSPCIPGNRPGAFVVSVSWRTRRRSGKCSATPLDERAGCAGLKCNSVAVTLLGVEFPGAASTRRANAVGSEATGAYGLRARITPSKVSNSS